VSPKPTALSATLPHATRVRNAFHVVRLGLAAVNDVRRRVQQQTLGPAEGIVTDPLHRGRRLLLRRNFMTLNQRQWTQLENTLVPGDPTGPPTQTWIVAQELMLLYSRSHDLTEAKHRLRWILDRCARANTPELLRLARTLDAWHGELLAAFTPTGRCPASNARPRPCRCSSRRSSASATASATWRTTASGSSLPWAWTGEPCTGKLRLPPAQPHDPRLVESLLLAREGVLLGKFGGKGQV